MAKIGWYAAVVLVSLLGAVRPLSADDLDLAAVEKAVAQAKGVEPSTEAIVTQVTDHGLSGTETSQRSGSDSRTDTTFGPFRTAQGVDNGVAWSQNANGETILRTPGKKVTALAESVSVPVLAHVSDPEERYVISRLDSSGFGTKDFVDPKTWHIVREERISPSGTTAITYDDFRTTSGSTRAWYWTVDDGHPENLATYRIASIETAAIAPATFAIPPDRRQLVEFPKGVTSVALSVSQDLTLHFIVRVTIGGRGLDFLIDSGAAGIVIDRDVAQSLGLTEYGAYSSAANADRYVGTSAIVPQMSVGPLVMHDVVVATIPHLGADTIGTKVVGLLGFDFLDAVALKIDYPTATVTAFLPSAFVPPADPNTMALDVRLGYGVPMTDIRINGTLGTQFGLDTGDAGGMLIFHHFSQRHPEAVVDADGHNDTVQYRRGVGGIFTVKVIAVAKFTIGDETFDHLVADVVDTPGAYPGNMDGVVGPDLFNIFTMYFDYGHRKVYMVPSADALAMMHRTAP